LPDLREHADISAKVERFFSAKLAEHGATPRGVDWNGDASQKLRFVQLARLLPADRPYSVTDVGCGYGAFVDHLDAAGHDFRFQGFDLSPAMVAAARDRHAGRGDVVFTAQPDVLEPTDYAVASGIFNMRLDVDTAAWERYVHDTLDRLAELGPRGFAFNMLTSYSDADRMRDDLYYPGPGAVFDLCKRRYARNVALLHDYGLWEFTILVRSELDAGATR
jgi:SAM-dependent methyltransferase